MNEQESIFSHIEGEADQDLAERQYDPEWYEEIEHLEYLTHPELQDVHRLSLSDEEWRKLIDEWGEEHR